MASRRHRPAVWSYGVTAVIANDEQWLAVADLFAGAALGGDWPAALDALADATGAERGELIGVGADYTLPFNWITRLDLEAINHEFVQIHGGDPAINPRVRKGIRSGLLECWHDVACSTDEELRRNFVYADFCRRWDIPYGSQTNLMVGDGMLIGLATLRTERQGRPEAADRHAFETFAPHIRAAVRTQIALEGQGAGLVGGALEAVGVAAFVCDGAGRVQAHTPAAEAALRRGLIRLRGRRLTAVRDEDARALEAAVQRVVGGLAPLGQPLLDTVVLRDPELVGGVEVVDVVGLPPRPFAFGFQPRALAIVRGARREAGQLVHVLRLAFGLSPAEAEIALRLSEGESREEIAEVRGASIETVRSQVKSLFAKLGVRRAGELAAKLNRLR